MNHHQRPLSAFIREGSSSRVLNVKQNKYIPSILSPTLGHLNLTSNWKPLKLTSRINIQNNLNETAKISQYRCKTQYQSTAQRSSSSNKNMNGISKIKDITSSPIKKLQSSNIYRSKSQKQKIRSYSSDHVSDKQQRIKAIDTLNNRIKNILNIQFINKYQKQPGKIRVNQSFISNVNNLDSVRADVTARQSVIRHRHRAAYPDPLLHQAFDKPLQIHQNHPIPQQKQSKKLKYNMLHKQIPILIQNHVYQTKNKPKIVFDQDQQKQITLNQFVNKLIKQVQFDKQFRQNKRSLNAVCKSQPQIWQDLKYQFQKRGLSGIPKTHLINMFTLAAEQYNPLISTNRQFSVIRLMDTYLQSQAYFKQNIYHSLNKQQIKQLIQKLKLKQSFLSLSDLTGFVNRQTGSEYRNRDFYLLVMRMGGAQTIELVQLQKFLLKQ